MKVKKFYYFDDYSLWERTKDILQFFWIIPYCLAVILWAILYHVIFLAGYLIIQFNEASRHLANYITSKVDQDNPLNYPSLVDYMHWWR